MNSAPMKSQIKNDPAPATAPRVTLKNPLLDEMISAFERQSGELDAAFTSVSGLADVQVAVRSELLDEIEQACTRRAAPRPASFSMTRC